MDRRLEAVKREINVFYDDDKDYGPVLTEICLGIEEEGIPYKTVELSGTKGIENLSFKAAESSRLGVGIGVGSEIALHYIKLKEDDPLFKIALTEDKEKLRSVGSNAARLVKGMPFKEVI